MALIINGRHFLVSRFLKNISLLDFIRDTANLKGTKFGCGKGLCGACTVHIDGDAIRSCQETVRNVEGRSIVTIEGLAETVPGPQLHPIQKAWIAESVPQCGYCQPGQIMAASALLNDNPNPSEEEVREEMHGNLCRCGTYSRIQRAIQRASKDIYYATR